MRWRRLASVGAALCVGVLAAACGPRGAEDGGRSTQAPGASTSALVGRVGQVLELTVPLVGGGRRELAELRGQAVLLELADAGSRGRDEAQARWRALVERHVGAVAVVCVAMDAEATAMPPSWTEDPPPFVLGWDPQGAVAARLQLRVLPTVVLLDAHGRIVAVFEGAAPDDAAIERWLSGSGPGVAVGHPRREGTTARSHTAYPTPPTTTTAAAVPNIVA
jgi:hypothetical protein